MPTGVESKDPGPAPSAGGGDGGISAPYGRACTNCSRAKCKCILRSVVGGACERCHRLGKACQPSNPVRRRSRRPASSRTAQLEEKLDGLVTLLRQSGRPNLPGELGTNVTSSRAAGLPPSVTTVRASSSELGDTRSVFGSASRGDSASSSSAAAANLRARGTSLPTPTQTESPGGAAEDDEYGDVDELPSPDEAEVLLEAFRSQNLKNFPFMRFRDTMTARELRAERPFLWLCIVTVASKTTSQQLALGHRVRRVVSQKLLIDNERSMDYLLGLMVVLGWANYQLGNKPFRCMFCQIAIGLVFDLELSRDPSEVLNPFLCWKAAQERVDREKTGTVSQTFFVRSQTPRTMEQRRAVVACYLITAATANFLGKMDPLRWTPYMDECLQMLNEEPESSSDRSLAALVKMQLLKDEAGKISFRFDASSRDGVDVSKPPVAMYVKTLQTQLQRIIQEIPPDLRSTDVIIAQIHSTELSIQEVALSSRTGACLAAHLPDIARLDILYACLHAVKAWFDHFFTLPPSSYFHMAFLSFSHLSHCTVALYRLSVLEDPVWDRASVRSTIDIIATLDEVANRFMRVSDDVGLREDLEEGTSFTKAVKTIRGLKSTWEAALAPFAGVDPAVAAAAGGGPGVLGAGGNLMGPGAGDADLVQFGLDMMENRLFTDVFIPFDF